MPHMELDRTGLAEFLRGRREALQPEDVGLPRGQRRRTEGLRREEVAVLSHMSTDYYARLERARGPHPRSSPNSARLSVRAGWASRSPVISAASPARRAASATAGSPIPRPAPSTRRRITTTSPTCSSRGGRPAPGDGEALRASRGRAPRARMPDAARTGAVAPPARLHGRAGQRELREAAAAVRHRSRDRLTGVGRGRRREARPVTPKTARTVPEARGARPGEIRAVGGPGCLRRRRPPARRRLLPWHPLRARRSGAGRGVRRG